jgi:hypothetical protein
MAHTNGPVHYYFELSYSTHDVRNRSLLQSMDTDWQERWVALMRELDAAYAHLPNDQYQIIPCRWTQVGDLTDEQRKEHGITSTLDNFPDMPEDPTPEEFDAHEAAYDKACDAEIFHDRDGNEIDTEQRIAIPVPEKTPHYQRGRTYIEPRL